MELKQTVNEALFSKTNAAEVLKGIDKILQEGRKIILDNSKQDINFAEAILYLNEQPLIFPHTINTIQGKSGTHKSRLVEIIAAVFLSQAEQLSRIGLEKQGDKKFFILYLDTERNMSEQFPAAIQKIRELAGYEKKEDLTFLEPFSFIDINREDRFEALGKALQLIEVPEDFHLIVILDVVTDCVENFNDLKKSSELIDLMNQMINKHAVTFINVIHENPSSGDKARGHLGTELGNKSSTVLKIGFASSTDDLIEVEFKKCRSTKRFEKLALVYSEEEKTLVLANETQIRKGISHRQSAAPLNMVIEALGQELKEPKSLNDLVVQLETQFNCSARTIKERLKTIRDKNYSIPLGDKHEGRLTERKEGREKYLSIVAK